MTKREWAEDMLAELHEDALFMDGFDEAIVGITSETEPRVVYDEEAIIDVLVAEGLDAEDAWDHYGFNVQGSLQTGDPRYPIIIRSCPEPDEEQPLVEEPGEKG